MKKVLFTLYIFSCLIAQAQIAPLLDHEWQLEKIVIDNEETLAEPDYNSSGDDWVKIYFDDVGFLFVALIPGLTYNDENSSFTIDGMAINLGDYHGAETSQIFEVPFIANEDVFEDWNNPFTYSFRYEDSFIFLDITNSNGDIATFFTTTLSSTNFEKVALTIYPNPTSTLLHIETNQTAITAVEIFDLQGKQVMQLNSTDLKNIDVSQFTNGMYFVKASTNEGVLTKKFVKK